MIRDAYRAVIFDMDGVLVDTEPGFYEAANIVLEREGSSAIEWERYKALLGTSVEFTWQQLIKMQNLEGAVEHYIRHFGSVLLDCLAQAREPLPGTVELLDELDQREIPYAIATSSWGPWKDIVLRSAGLQERFELAVTGDQVQHEKPAPDIYLRAADLIGVPAKRCVAVEDTPPGIASAKGADMYAVQVRSSSTAFPPIDAADLVIGSLSEFPIELLETR
jgi:HAD superfamily hydrolase (TIGR01509 family)